MKAVRRIEIFFQLVAGQCEKDVQSFKIVEFLQALLEKMMDKSFILCQASTDVVITLPWIFP